jgi:hypothetical protein
VHGLQHQHLELQDRVERQPPAFGWKAPLQGQAQRRAKELEVDGSRELFERIAVLGQFCRRCSTSQKPG